MAIAAADEKIIDAVLDAEHARCRATIEKDFGTLEKLLSRQLRFVHSSGHRDDYDRHLEILGSPTFGYQNIVRQGLKVRLAGSVAIMSGLADITFQVQDQPAQTVKVQIVQIWEQEGSHWRMSVYQATRAL